MIICGDRSFADVANEVIQKLIDQGGVCDDDGTCVYGNSRGQHCSIGWLLNPENIGAMYFEGLLDSIIKSGLINVEQNFEWIKRNCENLKLLQRFHDSRSAQLIQLKRLMYLGVDEKLMYEFMSICEEKKQ